MNIQSYFMSKISGGSAVKAEYSRCTANTLFPSYNTKLKWVYTNTHSYGFTHCRFQNYSVGISEDSDSLTVLRERESDSNREGES